MKKKLLPIIIVLIVILLIPIKVDRLKDGGSRIYKGLVYSITKIHALNEYSINGYEDGLRIVLFGKEIYNKTNIDKNYKKIDTLEGPITLVLKSGTLTNKGVTIVITNNSDNICTFGPEYYLEKEENGSFTEIKLEHPLTWNSIIYTLNPGENQEINIDFTVGYGKLANGKYRLVKKVSNKDINMYLSIEFEISDKKEILKLNSKLVSNTNLEPNKPKFNNINLKFNYKEELNENYNNNPELSIFTDYISKTFNIKIDNRWHIVVHYYTEDKTLGMVEFLYTIQNINTNKCIIFNLENGIANIVYYKYLDKKVDEEDLLNRVKLFESKYVQEKKELKNDEKFVDEKTNYTYYWGVDKLVYSYNLFFSYGEHNVINNDYGTEYIINKSGNIEKL